MLEVFGEEIWTVEGPTVTGAAGFQYPTRMVIIRLSHGELVVWSPIALTRDLREVVERLGIVRHLVPPNSLHHVFLGEWQSAFPDAVVYAPPGLPEKRPDIRFDVDFGEQPIAAWAGEIEHAVIRGNRITTEVALFHRGSRTAVFGDLIQHLPRGWFRGWRAVVARLDLMTADAPAVPRKFRAAFRDRRVARDAISPVLAWPTDKVIIAHGQPVTANGQAFLHQTFQWLLR
ncbi:hypothetical protein GCM10007989_09900 [Devosia pacifica]|uniref:DUF4336 domain-containing protein n=1 Tax=Devosia pacifica TaxID=1335967 RepID=A0A918RZI9_9HYPH|nr:DUF4336 domain-containing protein [Devosia pacifica]GHA16781.1 hypothetical protein GCM10007989_09900 [Devosia pacifica]